MNQVEVHAVDSQSLRAGMVVGGKFALLRRIGEGGVGVVFEAEDTWIGRRVALKVLHSHLVDETDVLARFRREARAAAMTNHPNIVSVFEVGQWHDGSPYIVQELLRGETVRERLMRKGRLPPAEAIEILVPIMGALTAAHRVGIIHRDIKPENIFLADPPEGTTGVVPKLIDFGIAKIASSEHQTQAGRLVGTPMYMSPEQASGASPDHRTDIWALGAVMYELLSDHCPHEGPSAAVVLGKILSEPIRPLTDRVPGLPADLAAVVHRALERDRDLRYASASDFLHALLAYAEQPDPTISARHARSIPPLAMPSEDVEPRSSSMSPEVLNTSDLIAADHTLVSGNSEDPAFAARPVAQPELGWYGGQDALAPRDLAWYLATAGAALRDNALDEAVDHAERGVIMCKASGKALGQMRLVQAIALRWLGRYAEAERAAIEASTTLPRQSPGWYTALGHVATLGGYLGRTGAYATIAADFAAIEAHETVAAEHVIATCRLAVSLVRAGHVERASRAVGGARRAAEPGTEDEPMVRAWIFVAVAELAAYRGDPTSYIKHLESAVGCFSEAGDVRNACLQRANIGNGYMQLGAFARARGLLREAIAVGEPMRLGFIAPVRANLAFVLARLGDVNQALELGLLALKQCVYERYQRFEVAARIYLGVIHSLRGNPIDAEIELRAAVAAATDMPTFRAYALANLAELMFTEERVTDACAAAREAMKVYRELEGLEEGESLIRLEHAYALESMGETSAASMAIAEARRRLLERADRISDPRLRRSFLDHIPENARTLALASKGYARR